MRGLQVAYSTDKGKTPLGGYGVFPESGGLNVVESESKPGERLTFMVRIAPTARSAGSAARRYGVSTFLRAPTQRIDYRRNVIRLRANQQIGLIDDKWLVTEEDDDDGEVVVTPEQIKKGAGTGGDFFPISKDYVHDNAQGVAQVGIITEKNHAYTKPGFSIALDAEDKTYYMVRTVATARRPASLPQVITVNPLTPINETQANLALRGATVRLPKGFELAPIATRNSAETKWRGNTKDAGTYAVRVRNTAKHNGKTNVTTGNPVSGNLILQVIATTDARGRTVNTGHWLFQHGSGASRVQTDSNVTNAIYINSARLNQTAALSVRATDTLPIGKFPAGFAAGLTADDYILVGQVLAVVDGVPAVVKGGTNPVPGAAGVIGSVDSDGNPVVSLTPPVITPIVKADEDNVRANEDVTITFALPTALADKEDVIFFSSGDVTISVTGYQVRGAVSNITISGDAGEAPTVATNPLTITLSNAEFNVYDVDDNPTGLQAGANVADWITNRPAGLTAVIAGFSGTDNNIVTITVGGTPAATAGTANVQLAIDIPATAILSATETVVIPRHAGAWINIAPAISMQVRIDAARTLITGTTTGTTRAIDHEANIAGAAITAAVIRDAVRTDVNTRLTGWSDMTGTDYSVERNGVTVAIGETDGTIATADATRQLTVTISGTGGTNRTVVYTVTGKQN
jgi:hypothetical protein